MTAEKIVVLDGYTLNPGDLDWSEFRALGDLTVHDHVPHDQVLRYALAYPIVLTNKAPLTADTLRRLPGLRYIGVLATGTNVVDLAAARSLNIPVTNVPDYSTDSVAQHTIGLLLELVGKVGQHNRAVHQGAWARSIDFSFTVGPTMELAGKMLGIVGLGAIGRRVARIAHAMGMRIAAAVHRQNHKGRYSELESIEVQWLELDSLFSTADVISLHCPLTDATRHLVNANRIARMKRTAYLLNTGRGPLIDESALASALERGEIAGAGLDVLSVEPPVGSAAVHRLLQAPRCVITPHIAWATVEARRRLMRLAAQNLRHFLEGRPLNVVN